MPSKYRISDHQNLHFISFSTVNWIDALSRPAYKEIVVDSFNFCPVNKGMIIYAWVIMSNHLHFIASAKEGNNLSDIIRDFKKFTSKKLLDAIETNPQESRKEWMLWMFERAGKHNINNQKYQFWQQSNHPVDLCTNEMLEQRLDYIHMNPVKECLVSEPEHYIFSSAIDYCGGKGKAEISFIE